MHQIHLFCSGAATSRQAWVVDKTDGSNWRRSWYWCRQISFYTSVDIDADIYFGAGKEALLVYQDDSSDEMEDVMNDLLVPASDTDDDFDEEDGDETMEVDFSFA